MKCEIWERRPGVWRARVRPPGRKEISRTFQGERADVEPAAAAWADEIACTLPVWLHSELTRQAAEFAPATLLRYRSLIHYYVRPETWQELEAADPADWPLARLPIKSITAADGAAYQRMLLDRGLGPQTVAAVMRLICAGLTQAARQGIIPHNPWGALPLVQNRQAHAPVAPPPDIRQFDWLRHELAAKGGTGAEAFTRGRLAMLIGLAADTGARRNELLACCWRHVLWDHGQLQIEGGLDGSDPLAPTVRPLRAAARRRRVTLTLGMLATLRTWRGQMGERALEAGRELAFVPILPGDPTGGSWWRPNSASQAARRAMRDAGMVGSLHSVRHSHAAALMGTPGILPSSVARRLGHNSARVTLALYTQAPPEQDAATAAAIAAALGPRKR